MPGFSYVAVDAAGKEVKGSMEADDKERVAEQLRKDGLCRCLSVNRAS